MEIIETKPWMEEHSNQAEKNIFLPPNKTLIDFFEENFLRYTHLPMVENLGKTLSYTEVDDLSRNFAAYIQNNTTLKPGDHVAIQLPNILQYPITVIGFLRAGMVIVNMNPLYTPYEMENQLKNSEAKAIVILENFADKLEEVLQKINVETVIITKIGDLHGTTKGGLINFTLKYVKKIIPKYNLPNAIKFLAILQLNRNDKFIKYEPKPTDAAFIQYTGGTTGVPKGAMLSHQNILANVNQIDTLINKKLDRGKEIVITALPFYHIFALTVNMFLSINFGAHSILITNPRDIESLIKTISKIKFTCFIGVSTLFNAMLLSRNIKKVDFQSLKLTIGGAMSIPKKIFEEWKQLTGSSIIEGYGLTEASPVVCLNPVNDTHKNGTIGLPIPGTEIKITSNDNKSLPYNVPGNLWIKGPQVMQGYWKNTEETNIAIQNGWLNTGDIASMDEEGFLKIIDRKKDVINVSGFNVYPSEIENVVLLNKKVKEVAAIGLPHNGFREVIKLYIIKNDNTLTEEEIINHCKKYLTPYKIPKHVEFRSELPKSNVGKIVKRVLLDEELKNLK